jgi:hypothetical protein
LQRALSGFPADYPDSRPGFARAAGQTYHAAFPGFVRLWAMQIKAHSARTFVSVMFRMRLCRLDRARVRQRR